MTTAEQRVDTEQAARASYEWSIEGQPERPYDLDWYLDFASWLEGTLQAGQPVAWQRAAVLALYSRFLRNLGDNDKRVLTGPRLDEFLERVDQVARRLDAAALADRIGRVPEHFRRYLLAARGEAAGPATVEIKSIMALDGELLVYGFVDSPGFGDEDVLSLRVEGAGPAGRAHDLPAGAGGTTTLQDQGLRHSYRYFGRDLVSYRAFDLRLPLDGLVPGTRLSWLLSTQRGTTPLRFSSAAARLAPDLGVSYVALGPLGLRYSDGELRVVKQSRRAAFAGELRALAGIRHAKLKAFDKLREFGLRLLYYLTRRFFSRRLVLYFDKLYMGGDNGQHLFEYASARALADGSRADHRYIAHPSSAAYSDLKRRGLKVVDFASPLRKLYALNAYVVAATHPNVFAYCGLNAFERRWYAAVLSAHVVCIQHGLTVQYIPQHQARQVDNTERYYCASPVEVANLRQPAYCYPENALKLTGLARYDGLVPDTRPVVLLCPTWRRYVANDVSHMGHTRQYTETFTASEFYRIYAGVLTDPELLAGLRERGYRLRFVLHPTLTEQAPDFLAVVQADALASGVVDVEAAADKGYEHQLRQGAILVTDYSGIQFDFATMRKPLVYFHPDSLPPSYPMGGYSPSRDGFGPVARDLASLRTAILDLVDGAEDPTPNSVHDVPPDGDSRRFPRLSEEYARRVDEFFPFADRRNSERIYAELVRDYAL